MLIRFATKNDFEEILNHMQFNYFNWDLIEDASRFNNARNISLYLEYRNQKFIFPLIRKKVFKFYPIAQSIFSGLYGGIIALNEMDTQTYTFLVQQSRKFLKLDIMFQNLFEETHLSEAGFTKIKSTSSHVVSTKEIDFKVFARTKFSHGIREGIKLAARNKIEIVTGNNSKLIDDFYKVYEASNLRWGNGKPQHTISFFQNFLGKKYIEVRVAYYNNEPVSALFILALKNYYFPWYGGFIKELRKLRANDYLYADLIKCGIENNCDLINLGASDALHGVRKFKESLGAKAQHYSIYFTGNPVAKFALMVLTILS